VDGIEKESISVTDTQLGWWEERNFGEEHSWCLGPRVNQGSRREGENTQAESEGGAFPLVFFCYSSLHYYFSFVHHRRYDYLLLLIALMHCVYSLLYIIIASFGATLPCIHFLHPLHNISFLHVCTSPSREFWALRQWRIWRHHSRCIHL
jgi:hypothetical protein